MGMAGTAGTDASVGGDISAYRSDMRFLILSSTADLRAFLLIRGFDSLDGERTTCLGSDGLRVRRDCMTVEGAFEGTCTQLSLWIQIEPTGSSASTPSMARLGSELDWCHARCRRRRASVFVKSDIFTASNKRKKKKQVKSINRPRTNRGRLVWLLDHHYSALP